MNLKEQLIGILSTFENYLFSCEKENIGFETVVGAPKDTLLPKRGTKCSAGYDFFAPEDIVLEHGLSDTIWLNIKAYMSDDMFLKIENRSSMMSKHNTQLFCSGIIDADYYSNPHNDGNIGIRFNNLGERYEIKKGDKICQGVFLKYHVIDGDNQTERRIGGFGSTGK